jgi:amino acid transporter
MREPRVTIYPGAVAGSGRQNGGDAAATDDPDAVRLSELGYQQELKRVLHVFDNVAVGFATISPVVGLFAVVLVGTTVAGPAWVWVLPVVLIGQCLVLAVYSELASEFPLANGVYQWSRRLVGPAYGWFSGWVALCAYAVANTTIAYLAAPWALTLFSIEPTPRRLVLAAAVVVGVASIVNLRGVETLKRAVRAGVTAETLACVGVGVTLLVAFRRHDLATLTHTLGAEHSSGGAAAALLAALAVGGWVFLGFDACVGAAEETRAAARQVPRALWFAVLSVGVVVILDAVAIGLAHPAPADIVAGRDVDPVTRTVVTAFGSWSARPFAAVVLVAFVACAIAAQGLTARAIYSVARDGVLPGARFLRRVDRRRVPVGALVTVTVIAWLGLLLALEATAIGSLIAFGTAALFLSLLLVASAALVARLTGRWRPGGAVRLGRTGTIVNALAVGWLAFETVNVAWPRTVLAAPDAPWYQIWAAPLVLAVIGAAGACYLIASRPTALTRGRDVEGAPTG